MEVAVQLFGNMERYRPEGADKLSFRRVVEAGATLDRLIKDLAIPDDLPVLAMINGKMAGRSSALQEKDEITIFSPAPGG